MFDAAVTYSAVRGALIILMYKSWVLVLGGVVYFLLYLGSGCGDRYPRSPTHECALPTLSPSDPWPCPLRDPLTANNPLQFMPLCSLKCQPRLTQPHSSLPQAPNPTPRYPPTAMSQTAMSLFRHLLHAQAHSPTATQLATAIAQNVLR